MKLLAILLISTSLQAGPLSWMKRHPKVSMVVMASASTAIMVLAHNRPGDKVYAKPQVLPQLKAITCNICTSSQQ